MNRVVASLLVALTTASVANADEERCAALRKTADVQKAGLGFEDDDAAWRTAAAAAAGAAARLSAKTSPCLSADDASFVQDPWHWAFIATNGLKIAADGAYANVNEAQAPLTGAPASFDGYRWNGEVKAGYIAKPIVRDLILAAGESGVRYYRQHQNDLIGVAFIDAIGFDLYGRYGAQLDNPDTTHGDFSTSKSGGVVVGVHYTTELGKLVPAQFKP